MKSVLCLLLVSVLFSASEATTLTTPFNFYSVASGYSINGTFCNINDLNGVPVCTFSRLTVDTPRNRWFLDLGTGGKYALTSNESYAWNIGGNPVCFKVANFNATTQVNNYKNAFSTSNINVQYTGLVDDVASCKTPVAVTIDSIGPLIKWSFGQRFPINGQCINVKAVLNYDLTTVEFTKNRDADFVLPGSCSSAIDFCSNVYYRGNPCYLSSS